MGYVINYDGSNNIKTTEAMDSYLKSTFQFISLSYSSNISLIKIQIVFLQLVYTIILFISLAASA